MISFTVKYFLIISILICIEKSPAGTILMDYFNVLFRKNNYKKIIEIISSYYFRQTIVLFRKKKYKKS